MKFLKNIVIMSLWLIGFGLLFGVFGALQGQLTVGPAVAQAAGVLVILVVAGVLYLMIGGIRKMTQNHSTGK